ncbi:hypothetical protein [Burkholderia sp. Bp9143]|uniref:hypothetical protein n=1 Tax=Burkholderia sp. Bp9143 TaxID=2184574 RepID=UPI000F596BDE|nr:hypothetical protein [Burkholderia sp. Bp9143]
MQKHHDREVHAFESATHWGRTGDRKLVLPHCEHSDENNRARQIAEQVSSELQRASRRHSSANAGAGREWLIMAELRRIPPRWFVTGSKRAELTFECRPGSGFEWLHVAELGQPPPSDARPAQIDPKPPIGQHSRCSVPRPAPVNHQ